MKKIFNKNYGFCDKFCQTFYILRNWLLFFLFLFLNERQQFISWSYPSTFFKLTFIKFLITPLLDEKLKFLSQAKPYIDDSDCGAIHIRKNLDFFSEDDVIKNFIHINWKKCSDNFKVLIVVFHLKRKREKIEVNFWRNKKFGKTYHKNHKLNWILFLL